MNSETLLSVCLGVALAAACGFRVFVPLLVLSLAGQGGYVELALRFEWIASTPATWTFAAATLLEIAAYYVPWVDNLLDSMASPVAVVAGAVAAASVMTEVDPFLKWTLAIVAGGGAAGAVQTVTAGTRGASSLLTAGLANPLVATAEAAGSVILSVLAILVPVIAVLALLALLALALRRVRRRRPAI